MSAATSEKGVEIAYLTVVHSTKVHITMCAFEKQIR